MKQFIVSFQVDERSLSKIDDAARSERKNRSKWIRDNLLKSILHGPDADACVARTAKEESGTAD